MKQSVYVDKAALLRNIPASGENGLHVAAESADSEGRFLIRGYTRTAYVIHAIWSGDGSNRFVMSATPVGIAAGVEGAEVRLVLDQPGDSYLERQRKTK
ncbi:MAG: hypothetical protein JWN34_140 [Bryobacterales bacterium]|nr:hypothetical protein [Bryobacterales bacterium]